ncbi:MAG: hypothetical protein IT201_12395 [Thermoleophilia bacterium]|nr:hypothetical protein [Thermoleophilia bacterium]
MARRRTWLQEERRKILGDWVGFCSACGHAQRYFEGDEAALPSSCPACGGPYVSRCPACEAPIPSVFAVDCEACGATLRAPSGLGGPIRRSRPGRS